MGIFDNLFGSKPAPQPDAEQQAVLILLNGTDLPQNVYDENDVSTLEDQLIAALNGSGELDGNEFGPETTTIYLYGSDAENLFTQIEPVLQNYPLCQQAKVIIRQGNPGAPQREVIL